MLPPSFTEDSHPSALASPVHQPYSDTITCAHPVAAYWSSVRCAAQRGIPIRLPMRLSSTGSFLFVPSYGTCSCHSLCLFIVIIKQRRMKCQEKATQLFTSAKESVTVHSVHSNTLRDAQKLYLWYNFARAILGFSYILHENTSRDRGCLKSNKNRHFLNIPFAKNAITLYTGFSMCFTT